MPAPPASLLAQAVRLFGIGQLEPAAQACARLIGQQPGNADAHYLLGLICDGQGKGDEAAGCFERFVRLKRASGFEDHRNLGIALARLQRLEAAAASFEKAVAIRPDAHGYSLLGDTLRQLGRHEAALECFGKALAIEPGAAAAHLGLGVVQMARGDLEQAAARFQDALKAEPRNANTHFNLAVALKSLGRDEAAIASLRNAVAIDPGHVPAQNSLGNSLKQAGQYDAALAVYERILARNDKHANALSMQALLRRQMCDWRGLEALEAQLIAGVRDGLPLAPFPLFSITNDPAVLLACARQYWQGRGIVSAPRAPGAAVRSRKLRLGYLSAEMRMHAMSCLLAELFETHDRSRFEVFAFSYGGDDGTPMRRRLERAFDGFFEVRGLGDEAIARRIREQEIDIAIDLTGPASGSRMEILASRPAPVQLHYVGCPGTLGAEFIDYLIVDPFLVPPEERPHYSEALIYLSQCYQANDRKRAASDRQPSRAEAGLPEDAFVFCCFNQTYKITPAFFGAWMRLLLAVPGSVLWLLSDNRWAEDNLRREAAARGVAPERLMFAPKVPLEEHLARHRLADLFLDTFPYNAHTTASDALWMGLPVLTCAGRSFASRVAGSLLHAVGLPELITADLAGYERLALELAREPGRLAALHRCLEATRATAPLFDLDRTREEIEQAYEQLWEIHRRGEAPRNIMLGECYAGWSSSSRNSPSQGS